MALVTNGNNKSETKTEREEKQEQQKENPANMVTIDRTKAEQFLLILEESIGDIEEQKALVDSLIRSKNEELQSFQTETIEKFNSLIQATKELSEKIKATESYENYLAEKLENANLSKSVTMLEQQLQKEKAEISSFIIKTDNFITLKINEILDTVSDLKTINEMVENQIQKFKEELQAESKKSIANADNQLEEASKSLVNGANVQYESLKAECNAMIKSYTEKCQQHLETVKKQSIDFLKQCEVENKKLIEKVPAVADRKISKKDVIIYILAVVAITSSIVQFIF